MAHEVKRDLELENRGAILIARVGGASQLVRPRHRQPAGGVDGPVDRTQSVHAVVFTGTQSDWTACRRRSCG
jgi:hypothetical protein